MKKENKTRRIYMECPLCDKEHEVEERIRMSEVEIKGERVVYEEIYLWCENSDEGENEFVTGKMLNANLLNARNQYRLSRGLLTSDEIVAIREQYGLSQVDLSKLLGWGEVTISRYESKAIQDEAYDNILRMIQKDALMTYKFLEKNREQFQSTKYYEIKNKIIENLDSHGKEYLKRQVLESEYIDYIEPCDANGYQRLNVDTLERMISYYAKFVDNLYKIKLMKMLWYADSLMYKKHGKAMSGLVYRHENMGALPIGHYRIAELENVNIEIEENFDYTKYRFLENENAKPDELTDDEINVLNEVVVKFKDYDAKRIVNYMHKEKAYVETKAGEIIPFSLAKEIKTF